MADEERATEQQCAASDEQAHRAPLGVEQYRQPQPEKKDGVEERNGERKPV